MKRRVIAAIGACALLAVSLTGCFTGVESTPRISMNDVKKQQAGKVTDEALFLAGLAPTPPSQWRPGHRLRVDDAKIGLALTSASGPVAPLVGRDLIFESFKPAVSLTGNNAVDLTFHADLPTGREYYYYRASVDMAALDTLESLAVPFTVDMELVARADSLMRGRKLYIRTPLWYRVDGEHDAVGGLRHVPVLVDSVVAGDANYPLGVVFTLADNDHVALRDSLGRTCTNMVYMTVGHSKSATRNFDTLFAFQNPRRTYPGITPDVWDMIVRSQVKTGMTREECRLAKGAPTTIQRIPTYGGMREHWSYSDGVFLIFDDGVLTRYRQ